MNTPSNRSLAHWRPLACSLAAALVCGAALAQTPPGQGMEERLRAQLRITTAQLQQAQNELAQLKSGAAPAAPVAAAPAGEVAELKKALARAEAQLGAERQGRAQATEGSQQVKAQAQAATERATAQVAQFRNAYDELLKMARASEAEAKNTQLYAVGQEILRAYETVDLGSMLASRQPFAAQSRVKYEQIAQQYGDKLYEGRFDARSVSAPAAPAAAQ